MIVKMSQNAAVKKLINAKDFKFSMQETDLKAEKHVATL